MIQTRCISKKRPPIRVLIVDDSATARMWIKAILTGQAGLEVVGEASGGAQAVAMSAELNPDVVTMDLLMPGMDGLEATRKIMAESSCKIIIVSSSADSHESSFAMKALAAGALFVVDKPSGPAVPNHEEGIKQLLTTVKNAGRIDLSRPRATEPRFSASVLPCIETRLPKIIVVGTSAGGPPALLRILKSVPQGFRCPIVVAQHMAAGYMAGMAQWLGSECQIAVRLAKNIETPLPGVVYLAPDGAHIAFDQRGQIVSEPSPPINRFRPSVDRLFITAATAYGKDLLAIVLSGMGIDGCEGAGKVRANGGQVIAQDEATSAVWGMPGAVAKANHANSILPLSEIANRLIEFGSTRKVG